MIDPTSDERLLLVKPLDPSPFRATDTPVSCTACNDISLTDDSEPDGMLACLRRRVEAASPVEATDAQQSAMEGWSRHNLMILWELRGHEFSDEATSALARSLYSDRRSIMPSCGREGLSDLGTACSSSAEGQQFGGNLRRCERLLSEHVQPELRLQERGTCLGLLDDAQALPQETCSTVAMDAALKMVSDYTDALIRDALPGPAADETDTEEETRLDQFPTIVPASSGAAEATVTAATGITTSSTLGDLPSATQSLDRYFAMIEAIYGSSAPEVVRDRLIERIAFFWSRVYAASNPFDDIYEEIDSEELADIVGSGLAADLAVLTTTFQPPNDEEPAPYVADVIALALLKDGLTSLAGRLSGALPLHDLACTYLDCDPDQQATELSEMIGLLAALDDAELFAARLGQARRLKPKYRALFERLGPQLSAFTSILSDSEAGTATERHVANEFLGFLAAMQAFDTNYRTVGRFEGEDERTLSFRMREDAQDQIVAIFGNELQALERRIDDYDRGRARLLNDLIRQVQAGSGEESATARVGVLSDELAEISTQMVNLRRRDQLDANRLDQLAEDLTALVENGPLQGQYVEAGSNTLNVRASDARYVMNGISPRSDPGVVRDALSIWDSSSLNDGEEADVGAGDIVTVATSGQWSPSCALRSARLTPPTGGDLQGIEIGEPLTGPAGYSVSWQTDRYVSQSESRERFESDTWGRSNSVCAGLGVGDTFGAIGISASANSCFNSNHSWGTRESQSDTETDSSRLSATFSGGLKLPAGQVPFPEAPVGSLLVVALDDDKLHAVDVVYPQTTLTYDRPVDLHLVVNDADAAECTDAQDSLSVTVQHFAAVEGSFAEDVSNAMVDALGELADHARRALAEGQLLPSEITALRNRAYLALAQTLEDTDPTNLPPLLRSLFDAWVDREVASIDRINALTRLDREARGILRQIEAAEVELEGAGDVSRLARLAPRWAIANLDQDELGRHLRQLTAFMRDKLHPVLEIRFPTVLDVPSDLASFAVQATQEGTLLSRQPDGTFDVSRSVTFDEMDQLARAATTQIVMGQFLALDELLLFDFEQPVDVQAQSLLIFANAIKARLRDARVGALENPWQNRRLVFPRPAREPDLPDPALPPYPQVDSFRAQNAWSEFLDGDINGNGFIDIVLNVAPEDLFSGNSSLNCDNALPVIDAMGLIVRSV